MSYTYAAVLGTQTTLCFAELETVLQRQSVSSDSISRRSGIAFFESKEAIDADALMDVLGGTIKIVEMVGTFSDDAMTDWLFEQIDTSSKFHFGFSEYAIDSGVSLKKDHKTLQSLGLALKRALKNNGISCRYVQSKEIALSSVIVHKERLLKNGVEIVLFKGKDEILFGKTIAVQRFQAFSKRDYGRPSADARNGMLPPKLARMMVNISGITGAEKQSSLLLDPFCGSGTVLQEALLLGVPHVIGSDLSSKAVSDTNNNLDWLQSTTEIGTYTVKESSAQNILEQSIVDGGSCEAIVFEGYLGPTNPKPETVANHIADLQKLYEQVLPVLEKALADDGTIVAALPFWMLPEEYKGKTRYSAMYLNVDSIVATTSLELQYEPFTYRRQHSGVGRHILVLQ